MAVRELPPVGGRKRQLGGTLLGSQIPLVSPCNPQCPPGVQAPSRPCSYPPTPETPGVRVSPRLSLSSQVSTESR